MPPEDEDFDDDMSPEELREQRAADRAALQAEREARARSESRLDEMLRGTRSQAAPQAPAPLGPPPNPAEDPEGFQRWLAESNARGQRELDARLERHGTEVRQTVSQESRAALLWERFAVKYPVYAERRRLVEVAYGELMRAGKLPLDNEKAVDAVKREMDAMAGLPIDRAAADDNRTDDPARLGRSPTPRKRGAPAEEVPVSMTDAIYKEQVRVGLRS